MLQAIGRAVVMCSVAGISLIHCGAQELKEGGDFSSKGCYASLRNGQLVVGNAHIRRTWRVEHGQLFPASFRDLDRNVEWINTPATLPSPTPPVPVASDHLVLRGGSGVFGPTQAESLRIELEVATTNAVLDYEFQIFPESSGVRMWLVLKGETTEPSLAPDSPANRRPLSDAMEHLQIANPHLLLTQVTMFDRTDEHNQLVDETRWLLHPNESLLELQGNVFVLEYPLTGNGLIFLKEAPQPEMRAVKTPFDAWFSGSAMAVKQKGGAIPTAHMELSFYGHGLAGSGQGYPWILMTFHGGRAGQIATLHDYQRQIRQYVPERDGQLMTNTWGDRSGGSKINESFIRKEIDAGKSLGVDIVQIDDGWQTGKTTGTVKKGGVWNDYWNTNPHFWFADPALFPHGLRPLSDYARERGMKLGLWFAPDSYDDFATWRKDADRIESLNREDGVVDFKLDSVKIASKQGEINYLALLDSVQQASSGEIQLEPDVTAETRLGYFGDIAAGPLFVENRYTDWHTYWPHQTLRNFWMLSQYVDPIRLRMEFLNSERNIALYPDDPLAPVHYQPACLFATTMFGSPLGFFENSGLSANYVRRAAPIIAQWKREREAIYRGTTLPIGEAPDGVAWTGFASLSGSGGGFLLVFRELNSQAEWTAPRTVFPAGNYRIRLLGGEGSVSQAEDGFHVTIPEPLGFVWVKLEPAG